MSFENTLDNYLKVDDRLKKIADEAKQLRKNKTDLENLISKHMVDNDIGEHHCCDSSRIKIYTKKSTKSSYNRGCVYECALTLLGEDKAQTLVSMIDDRKEVKSSTGLKRLRV